MGSADRDERVLVFAPIGRDALAAAELFRLTKVSAVVCPDLATLTDEIEAGAGAVFLAEEGLFGKDTGPLARWVDRQPPWSDLPFIVLTSHQEQLAVLAWRRNLVALLRNVSLLERPVHAITLTSSIQAALRARRRQYEIHDMIGAREQASRELERLVVERTSALEDANRQLRVEMAERTRMEETLRQAQKMEAIGQLTGGIAHDFNNLLMVISGGLEMLPRQTDADKRTRLMEGMLQAAQRGRGLTRQLLAFSRRQELNAETVDIARQIETMRDLLDRSLGGEVHVELDFADALWPVELDPGELELVVINLAVNARDAMPKGGTIVVRGENMPNIDDPELTGDYVRLSVSDTGTGMPPEVQAHVFEPYFTTKEAGKGSGLGLAQVYGFAAQSRGTVRIDSAVGRGTTVALYLPRSDRSPPLREHGDPSPTERQLDHRPGSILLVEDDDEVAALAGEMLNHLGYEVTRAATAAAALGALANGRSVDVVFTDVMMPGGMNGFDLALEIRRRRADLPVLLTSGYADSVAQRATAEHIRILPKPYGLDELSDALHRVISG
ncbi:MAG TPA: ATP-binding protein [Rhizomicrobium sp.]|nr:ATP-binding protein [Rhizomicrobium sp.]